MATKDKKFDCIESTDEIPDRRVKRDCTYDKIIFEFMESGLKIARVKPILDKHPKSLYATLRKRVGEGNYPIVVTIRGEEIYLTRNSK